MVAWCLFFSLLHPSLAVFQRASAFNQDVSEWNTEAVNLCSCSKCALSLTMATSSGVVYFLIYDNSSVIGSPFSHVLLFLLFVCLKRYSFFAVCGGLAFFLFVAPSLAVFKQATLFNQDVSKWNTGAVTNMGGSKCTSSPSLWPRFPLLCILNIRQLEFYRITLFTVFVFFVFVFF